jgi:hypothetical protein
MNADVQQAFSNLRWLVFLRSLTAGQLADFGVMVSALYAGREPNDVAMSFFDSLTPTQFAEFRALWGQR